MMQALEPNGPSAVCQAKGTWIVECCDRSVHEKGDAITQLVRGAHVVRGQEDGRASVPQLANQLAHEARGDRIKARRWFIQKQQLGTMKESTR
jgi:hypothetical protein